MSTLFYVVDPMCSWCYAFSPTWQKILENLPSDIKVVYVQGGLAPISNDTYATTICNRCYKVFGNKSMNQ